MQRSRRLWLGRLTRPQMPNEEILPPPAGGSIWARKAGRRTLAPGSLRQPFVDGSEPLSARRPTHRRSVLLRADPRAGRTDRFFVVGGTMAAVEAPVRCAARYWFAAPRPEIAHPGCLDPSHHLPLAAMTHRAETACLPAKNLAAQTGRHAARGIRCPPVCSAYAGRQNHRLAQSLQRSRALPP